MATKIRPRPELTTRLLDLYDISLRDPILPHGWLVRRFLVPDAVVVEDQRTGGQWQFSVGTDACGRPALYGAVRKTRTPTPRPLAELEGIVMRTTTKRAR